MLREIIIPKNQDYMLHIPVEYLNTQIEILVLPFEVKKNAVIEVSSEMIEKTAGLLAGRKINPVQWQREMRGEWDDRV